MSLRRITVMFYVYDDFENLHREIQSNKDQTTNYKQRTVKNVSLLNISSRLSQTVLFTLWNCQPIAYKCFTIIRNHPNTITVKIWQTYAFRHLMRKWYGKIWKKNVVTTMTAIPNHSIHMDAGTLVLVHVSIYLTPISIQQALGKQHGECQIFLRHFYKGCTKILHWPIRNEIQHKVVIIIYLTLFMK